MSMDLKEAKGVLNAMYACDDYRRNETMWRRIQEKQLPFLGELSTSKENESKKDSGILDGIAWKAATIFAGGMTNGSVPQSIPFFDFDTVVDDQRAKEIAQERREISIKALNYSNFYPAVHYAYMEMPFGQSPVGTFFDPTKGIHFENYSIGSYAYSLDHFRDVKAFALKKKYSYLQLANKFGVDKLPSKIKADVEAKKNLTSTVTCYWLVTDNKDYDPKALGKEGKRFSSLYWIDGEQDFISEGGFAKMPIAIAPYMPVPNSNYCLGCGWFADSDTAMMNEQLKQAFGNMELFRLPPLVAPAGTEVRYGAGEITEIEDTAMNRKIEPLVNVQPVFQQIFETMRRTEGNIENAYHVNLFAMLQQTKFNGQGRTAFELDLREQEKMQLLTPVITRINHEFLGKIIELVYYLLDVNGLFPPVEEELQGLDLTIKYVSPLAQVQKMSTAQSYNDALNFITQVAQVKPEVLGLLDAEELVRGRIDRMGIDVNILLSEDEYAQVIQAEQAKMAQAEAQQQEAQQVQQATMVAPAVNDFADAARNINDMVTESQDQGINSILSQIGE